MAMHLIPDDGSPHTPTSECGCGPVLLGDQRTYAHRSPVEPPPSSPPLDGGPFVPAMGVNPPDTGVAG